MPVKASPVHVEDASLAPGFLREMKEATGRSLVYAISAELAQLPDGDWEMTVTHHLVAEK